MGCHMLLGSNCHVGMIIFRTKPFPNHILDAPSVRHPSSGVVSHTIQCSWWKAPIQLRYPPPSGRATDSTFSWSSSAFVTRMFMGASSSSQVASISGEGSPANLLRDRLWNVSWTLSIFRSQSDARRSSQSTITSDDTTVTHSYSLTPSDRGD